MRINQKLVRERWWDNNGGRLSPENYNWGENGWEKPCEKPRMRLIDRMIKECHSKLPKRAGQIN